jgi:hypothetical protein
MENIERINQKAKADKTQDLVLNSSYGGRFINKTEKANVEKVECTFTELAGTIQ